MSEKLLDKKEYSGFILEIYWGNPPEFVEHTRDICSVYVKSKTEENTLFIEQTHISHKAELIAKDVKNLKEKLIDYTVKKAKDRINLRKYQKGKTYAELITANKFEQWLDKGSNKVNL